MTEDNEKLLFNCCAAIIISFLTFVVCVIISYTLLIDSYSCPKNNYWLHGTKLCTEIPNNTFDASPNCSDYNKLLSLSVFIFSCIFACYRLYR